MATLLDLALGVVCLTWFPAGLASASITYAITVRRHPENFLRARRMNEVTYVLMVLSGWLWYATIALGLLCNPEYRGSGLMWPGRRAKEEAERLRYKRLMRPTKR